MLIKQEHTAQPPVASGLVSSAGALGTRVASCTNVALGAGGDEVVSIWARGKVVSVANQRKQTVRDSYLAE